jgi:threonine synthase
MSAGNSGAPMIALACAHPAKFPDVVERATGARPVLPAFLGDILERRERMVVLPNDLGAVMKFIRTHARCAGNS